MKVKTHLGPHGYDVDEIKKKIMNILKQHPDGLSIAELSRLLKMSRITTSKYVLFLEGAGEVRCRKVGVYKLIYPIK